MIAEIEDAFEGREQRGYFFNEESDLIASALRESMAQIERLECLLRDRREGIKEISALAVLMQQHVVDKHAAEKMAAEYKADLAATKERIKVLEERLILEDSDAATKAEAELVLAKEEIKRLKAGPNE